MRYPAFHAGLPLDRAVWTPDAQLMTGSHLVAPEDILKRGFVGLRVWKGKGREDGDTWEVLFVCLFVVVGLMGWGLWNVGDFMAGESMQAGKLRVPEYYGTTRAAFPGLGKHCCWTLASGVGWLQILSFGCFVPYQSSPNLSSGSGSGIW